MLNSEFCTLQEYFTWWKLWPNPNKTEISAFHFNNKQTNLSFNVTFYGHNVIHNFNPKYLEVTLYWTFSYKIYLSNIATKITSRYNIIQKLTGTEWGADFSALRRSAIALVYSITEYCALVWINSSHIKNEQNHWITVCVLYPQHLSLSLLNDYWHVTWGPPVLRRKQAQLNEFKDLRTVRLTLFESIISHGIIGLGGAYNSALLSL